MVHNQDVASDVPREAIWRNLPKRQENPKIRLRTTNYGCHLNHFLHFEEPSRALTLVLKQSTDSATQPSPCVRHG